MRTVHDEFLLDDMNVTFVAGSEKGSEERIASGEEVRTERIINGNVGYQVSSPGNDVKNQKSEENETFDIRNSGESMSSLRWIMQY